MSKRSRSSLQLLWRQVFTTLDQQIIQNGLSAMEQYEQCSISFADALCKVGPSSSGSSATTVLIDPVHNRTYVACMGHSRAVLGTWDDDKQKWAAHPFSTDQVDLNGEEVERILSNNPGGFPKPNGRVIMKCKNVELFRGIMSTHPPESPGARNDLSCHYHLPLSGESLYTMVLCNSSQKYEVHPLCICVGPLDNMTCHGEIISMFRIRPLQTPLLDPAQ